MFTIIRCEDQRKGLAKLFVRRKYYVDTVCEEELRFIQLLINDREQIDWERIRQILGYNRGAVLVEDGISVPPDSGIALFEPTHWRRQLACNAAVALLRQMQTSGKGQIVALVADGIDPSAELRALFPYCRELRLISEQADAFAEEPRLILTDRLAGDENLLLIPVLTQRTAAALTMAFRAIAIVGCIEEGASLAGTILTDFAAELPAQYIEYMPLGMDSEAFAAAFFSCCKESGGQDVLPDHCDMLTDGKVVVHRIDFHRQIL